MPMLAYIRRWITPLAIGLVVLLTGLVWFAPAERTLGQTVKLVYLHGALVRTAVVLFAISLPVNLIATLKHQSSWLAWGKALTWAALAIWLTHTLVSMITTYASWGVWIAWYEPRTRFTFNLAGAGLATVLAAYLVGHGRFTALAFAALAGVILVLLPGLGFIQHPLDPIGTSPSDTIRLFYAVMLAVSVALAGVLVVWLRDKLGATEDHQKE